MPVSNRRKFFNMDQKTDAAAKAYEIIDPHFQPTMDGKFTGGYPIVNIAGRLCVRLTEEQAKFHVDQMSIRPLDIVPPPSGASGASGATGTTGNVGVSGSSGSSGSSGAS